jgi:uncharacterized membrane protein (UPF0127 family)
MKRSRHIHHPHHDDHAHHRSIAGALLTLSFLIVSGALLWPHVQPSSAETRTVDLSGFRLEIADTDEARRVGLGGHAPLHLDEGMLFVFGSDGIHPFWMKGMTFPLDIIWLDDGKVVDMATLPAPTSEDSIPAIHAPTAKADMVLELNAGRAKQLGLEPGAKVILP